MMNYTKLLSRALCVACACGALAFSLPTSVRAQSASTTYRGTGRDPFVKYRAPVKRAAVAKKGPMVVESPTIQERISAYKTQKVAAMSAQRPVPKPTTALLLSETQVTGIFRTPRGYAAMVTATPIKLSYVIYPGENFYDGMLVAIEEDRLVFRRETRWSDGRREQRVETKTLGQANAVRDSLSGGSNNGAPVVANPATPGANADVPKPKSDSTATSVAVSNQ